MACFQDKMSRNILDQHKSTNSDHQLSINLLRSLKLEEHYFLTIIVN